MDLGLSGKVAIVTGGGQGIGRAAVLTLAQEGSKVVVADVDMPRSESVAQEVAALNGEAKAIHIDVTDFPNVQRAIKYAADHFGQIDILVNVAGAWRINYFMDMKREDWDVEVKVCYYGVLNCTRAALEYMLPQKRGSIVSIASDAGRVGEPNQPVYSGAKAAVIGFSRALAKDVGRHGIRVNVVSPSFTFGERQQAIEQEIEARGDKEEIAAYRDRMKRTLKMYPLRKLGTPQDVASAVAFLASARAAGHITGQTLSVNGGYATF